MAVVSGGVWNVHVKFDLNGALWRSSVEKLFCAEAGRVVQNVTVVSVPVVL